MATPARRLTLRRRRLLSAMASAAQRASKVCTWPCRGTPHRSATTARGQSWSCCPCRNRNRPAARGNAVIDYFDVWREGTHAIYIAPGDGAASGKGADAGKGAGTRRVRIDTVAAHRGDRPWAPVLRKPAGDRPAGQSPLFKRRDTAARAREWPRMRHASAPRYPDTRRGRSGSRPACRALRSRTMKMRAIPKLRAMALQPIATRPAGTADLNNGAANRRGGPGYRPDRGRKCAS